MEAPADAPAPSADDRPTVARRRSGPAARRFPLPAALGTVALVAAAVVSTSLAARTVWAMTWHRPLLDLSVYLMGAHHVADGRLYTASLAGPVPLPFTYPPFAALCFLPLTALGSEGAGVAWNGLSLVSLVAVIFLTLRLVRPGLGRRDRVLWSLALSWPALLLEPVHLTLYFGQVNLELTALLLADLTCTLRVGGRTLPRGVLVGVAAAVKLIPLVFVPYLFVTGRVKAAWTALASFAACSLLAAAVDPRVSWSYWTVYATDAKRVGGVEYISDQSLRGTVDRLAHHLVAAGPTAVLSGAVLVAGIALARWAWSASSPLLGVLVTAVTGLLVSPITWAHHMVWIVPVVLWLALAPDRPPGGWAWAAAASLLFWWAPIWHVPNQHGVELHEHGWQLVEGNAFAAASVAFLVGVTVLLVTRRRSPVGDGEGPPLQRGRAEGGRPRRVRLGQPVGPPVG